MTRQRFRRHFLHAKRNGDSLFATDKLSLVPAEFHRIPYTMDECEVYIFHICVNRRIAGEIALRLGEGDAIYYLGHIGYHIDPPFRGHHYAAAACEALKPVFPWFGMNSLVITTDPDNIPSIKTCLKIGCLPESTVNVPGWCQKAYECSPVKKRFVFWKGISSTY